MEEVLIAPCGMNCALCTSYLAMKYDLKKKGFSKGYCPGCRPRGKNCAYMKKYCVLLGSGLAHYCFECQEYPCEHLKHLDKRYRTKYHMSMLENLASIQENGMAKFLADQAEKWRCAECGGTISCHNGLCFNCGLDVMKANPKYRWGEQ